MFTLIGKLSWKGNSGCYKGPTSKGAVIIYGPVEIGGGNNFSASNTLNKILVILGQISGQSWLTLLISKASGIGHLTNFDQSLLNSLDKN